MWRRTFLTLFLLAVLVVVDACCDSRSFEGLGPIRDTGVFSYPRYHAPLGKIPLHKPGEYKFVFSGLPDEAMALMLYVPGFTSAERKLFEGFSTHLAFKILDSEGNLVCEGDGMLNGKGASRWVLMSSSDRAGFWNPRCNGTQFKQGTRYTLIISVSKVDPSSPQVVLEAVLEGGGIELP